MTPNPIDTPHIEFCTDNDVQQFIETELADFNPYRKHHSARSLFMAARKRFGDYRCWDLEFWQH